jgi:hypothetical protein
VCSDAEFSSTDPQVVLKRNMFPVKANAIVPAPEELEMSLLQSTTCIVDAAGYLSDWSDEDDVDEEENLSLTTNAGADGDDTNSESEIAASKVACPQKRQRLDVPYHKEREAKRTQWLLALAEALTDIDKLINSKKTKFVAGPRGL